MQQLLSYLNFLNVEESLVPKETGNDQPTSVAGESPTGSSPLEESMTYISTSPQDTPFRSALNCGIFWDMEVCASFGSY